MSASVLVHGVIFKTPEQRQNKAGGTYVLATLRTREGDAVQYWRVLGFNSSTQEELLRLDDGDSVAVQGTLRADIYKPEHGEPRVSLNIMCDRAIGVRTEPPKGTGDQNDPRSETSAQNEKKLPVARPPRKARKAKTTAAPPSSRPPVDPELNDEVPW